jgi:hypothetical protein
MIGNNRCFNTGFIVTTTSMSIDASMIAENDRVDEEIIRTNFARFLTAQEEESRRCQRLIDGAAGVLPGIVSMQ